MGPASPVASKSTRQRRSKDVQQREFYGVMANSSYNLIVMGADKGTDIVSGAFSINKQLGGNLSTAYRDKTRVWWEFVTYLGEFDT